MLVDDTVGVTDAIIQKFLNGNSIPPHPRAARRVVSYKKRKMQKLL
jgi:hypothetical protein